jgi:Pyruvate/2-oxoacid:ferredoxin oxidoreductase delta subunit
MDLSPILKHETCANCKICCVFKPESLIYVPKEIEVKKQEDGMFACIHRCENAGCTLEKNKPTECAAWPFSISKRGGKLLLVLEHSCPELNKRERFNEVKKFALENVAPKLLEYSRKNTGTLREHNSKNQILDYYI